MFVLISCWLFVVIVMRESVVWSRAAWCERSRAPAPAEGVIGSTGVFPWLGVLRVHLHQESGMKIALTGIVLVKENYAVGHADDIARIPKRVFLEDSRAMFIPKDQKPWFCKLVDYITHPEYDLQTLNTIAIVELSLEEVNDYPMKPACWPPAGVGHNFTSHLYAVGYTDENQVLEKFIHKLEFVEPELCKEFYNRAGLLEGSRSPAHVTCGHAASNRDNCVWDNGMALVDNSSGHWLLLGLGLHGPGCSAPARFISLREYFPWIEAVTDVQDQPSYRKTAFNTGFQPRSELKYVPAHELLRSDVSPALRQGNNPPVHQKHEFAHYYPYEMIIDDPFHVTRVNGTRIDIVPERAHLKGQYGNCTMPGLGLIFKDHTDINILPGSKWKKGVARYQLTLMNTEVSNYTCVSIRLYSLSGQNAYLHYSTVVDDGTIFPETPLDIIRAYPLYELSRLIEKGDKDHLIPSPIQSSGRNIAAYAVNLYLEAKFIGSCKLEIAFYGPAGETPVTRYPTTTSTSSTTTDKSKTTTDPYKSKDETLVLRDEKGQLANGATWKGNEDWLTGLIVLTWFL